MFGKNQLLIRFSEVSIIIDSLINKFLQQQYEYLKLIIFFSTNDGTKISNDEPISSPFLIS